MTWIMGMALTCLLGSIVRLCTVQDPKSGTGKALRFLSSVVLILAMASPFLSPLPDELSLPQELLAGQEVDAAGLVLEKSAARIRTDAAAAFPQIEFSLEAAYDEAGSPYLALRCDKEEEGRLLCDYIQTKFQLTCRMTERK